ncbi:MAG: TlpA family protein disulfide reductase [Cytophagales bacterium]|nr:TlpA family protein disulfide reductase [Cytophagales bacterium]
MRRAFILMSFFGCFSSHSQTLSDGLWNGYFQYAKVQAPFTFEITGRQDQAPIITLINGADRQVIEYSSIVGDSIFIPLDPFDATLRARYSDTEMVGIWKKNYQSSHVTFKASFGEVRFKTSSKSYPEIDSKWAIEFKPGTADKYPAVGLFEQEGNKVMGTLLTEVGDFRFFEGVLDGDSIKMSSFDGVHAFMLMGIQTDEGWEGEFYFEKSYSENWVATYDNDVEIADPFGMVVLDEVKHKPYYDLLGAGSGRNSIDVSKYAEKVVIIQVFGTWCPNSFDQTRFLVDWYKSKNEAVEIVGSTYEPNYSKEYGLKRIADYKSNLGIPYDIYLGGQLSKAQAAFSFPFIDRINAFPTLVILDKNGYARYVHSYFNGPATGDYYTAFKNDLNRIVNELLSE